MHVGGSRWVASLGLCPSRKCRKWPFYNPQGSAEATWAAGIPLAQCHRPFSIRRVFPSPMKSLQKRWPSEVSRPLRGETQPFIKGLQAQNAPGRCFLEPFLPQ